MINREEQLQLAAGTGQQLIVFNAKATNFCTNI